MRRYVHLRRIVITWVSTQMGGAEESIRVLSSAIQAQYDLEIHLIIWSYSSNISFGLPAVDQGVELHECSNYQEYRRCVARFLDGYPKETVLFGNHRAFITDVEEAKLKGVKCAIVFRGIVLPEESIRIIPSLTEHDLRRVTTALIDWQRLSEADAVIGISDCSANSLKKVVSHPEKVFRIYNGVASNWFLENAAQIHSNESVRTFLISSRLLPWKSIQVGLIGFLKLAAEFSFVKLNVIGDGPELSLLRDIVTQYGMGQRVFFHGWQTNPWEWYRKTDCLIHPSPVEGFGRVIAEANASGLVAVVPQSGAAGELVINGHTGFTFEKGSSDDCHNALKQFMHLDLRQRVKMSKQAFNRAKALFSATRMAEEYVSLANQLLQDE